MYFKEMQVRVNLTSTYQEVRMGLPATERAVQALLSFSWRHLGMPVKLRNFF
jgi:hypothetical protein